jgi:hypothetical protein
MITGTTWFEKSFDNSCVVDEILHPALEVDVAGIEQSSANSTSPEGYRTVQQTEYANSRGPRRCLWRQSSTSSTWWLEDTAAERVLVDLTGLNRQTALLAGHKFWSLLVTLKITM